VTDLRADRPIADRHLDHSYVAPGSPVTLWVPPVTLRVETSRRVRSVHVHTPARGICIEPMTGWPNAANLATAQVRGTRLAILRAGGRLAASMTRRWDVDPG
jgi:galactose mutarotase-like enzyme